MIKARASAMAAGAMDTATSADNTITMAATVLPSPSGGTTIITTWCLAHAHEEFGRAHSSKSGLRELLAVGRPGRPSNVR